MSSPSGRRIQDPKLGLGYIIDVNYFITQRHIFSVNYTTGYHKYRLPRHEEVYASSPSQLVSNISFRFYSLMYKYRVANTSYFSLALGTGIGFITNHVTFPVFEKVDGFWELKSVETGGGTDLSFPFKVELSFNIARNWALGLEGGINLNPVYPFSGLHLLPRLSYIFR